MATAEKSTNVRIRILSSGFGLLQGISPSLGARAASWLFFRTPARAPIRRDTIMPRGRRLEIPFETMRLRATTWGAGATVLLLHGWGGRSSQLRAFVEPLVEAGYRVVALDAPGHGASPGSKLSLVDFAHAIRATAEVAGPIHAIVAHSFGGAAVSHAIAEGLEVHRAVLIGAPADALRWFELFVNEIGLSDPAKREARDRIEGLAGAELESLSAEAVGPRVDVPLLIVHDRNDREVPWDDGSRIARATKGAVLLTTEGLGHRRILRDPEVIAKVVSFVDRGVVDEARSSCRICHAPLAGEAWDRSRTLCLSCGVHVELSERAIRWSRNFATHPSLGRSA
jgi:pimeloyl-ACP methyl ester carboxylesterase